MAQDVPFVVVLWVPDTPRLPAVVEVVEEANWVAELPTTFAVPET